MRRAAGFTLIELLAAMAILAVVSVMAVQMLGGVLVQRDILWQRDDDAARLARALALLRRDLESVVPVPVEAGDDATIPAIPAIAASGSGLVLMRAGTGTGSPGLGRVDWRLRPDGTLTRQVTPASEPAGPEVTVLDAVTALRLSALVGELPDADAPERLPAGFDLTLDHRRHGALRIVVAR